MTIVQGVTIVRTMTIWNLVIFGSWLVFVGYWLIAARKAKKTIRRSWWPEVGLRLAILVTIILLLRVPSLHRFFRSIGRHGAMPGIAGEILGTSLCVIGIGSAIWARVHIGRYWGMPMSVKENPGLVMSGPYAYVRHPIYAGLWLALLGSALAESAWWLIALVFAGAYFLYSARAEEKLMLEQFSDEYRAYMKRTKMFIPFLV